MGWLVLAIVCFIAAGLWLSVGNFDRATFCFLAALVNCNAYDIAEIKKHMGIKL